MHGKTDHKERQGQDNTTHENRTVLHRDRTKKCTDAPLIGSKDVKSKHQKEIPDKNYELNSARDLGSTTAKQTIGSETHGRRQQRDTDNCDKVPTEPQGQVSVEVEDHGKIKQELGRGKFRNAAP